MPTVFLSYSREDLPLIEQLEAQLRSHPDISIWRDQEKIYGGQKWPKVLGEAIADQDVFLLVWSKNAATSYLVEFEWQTALALKKTIAVYLFDRSSLPQSLVTARATQVNNPVELVEALHNGVSLVDGNHRGHILSKLELITTTSPEDVLQVAKSILTTSGRIGESELNSVPFRKEIEASTRTSWEKWMVIVAIPAAIVAVFQIQEQFRSPQTHGTEVFQGTQDEVIKAMKDLGKHEALENDLFHALGMPLPPLESRGRAAQAFAQQHHELQARMARLSSSEAEVEELFHKAQQAAEDQEYSKAGLLLDEAIQRDQEAARELQEIATARLTLAAAKQAANGDLQATQADLFKARAFYDKALNLLPLTDTEHRGAYHMKLGKVLQEIGLGAAGPDIEKFLSEADQMYRDTVTDSVKETRQWAEANYLRCQVLLDRYEFARGESRKTLLNDAVTSCKNALTVYTKEKFPYKWLIVTGQYSKALQIGGPLSDELKSTIDSLKRARDDVQFLRSVAVNLPADLTGQNNFGDSREIPPLAREALTALFIALGSSPW